MLNDELRRINKILCVLKVLRDNMRNTEDAVVSAAFMFIGKLPLV